MRVAKGLSSDLRKKKISGKPPQSYRAEKRRGHGICRNCVAPPLLSSITQGGILPGGGKKIIFLLKSLLRPLATRIPSLGRVGQCAWELGLPQIRKWLLWVTLACLDISSKKKCLYRLFIYHFKAHTISNKLVSKVFAQKKGKKVMTATNMCYNFVGFR